MEPVLHPVLTDLLVKKWAKEMETPKPTAMETSLRYSGANGCLRQMGYNAFNAQRSEPIDLASAWVMGLGTTIHERLQAAIGEVYPEAIFEEPTQLNEFISGSSDGFFTTFVLPGLNGGDSGVVYELKTMGEYGFKKGMGYSGFFKNLKKVAAEGPSRNAITQAGMNALALELKHGIPIDWLIMGIMTYEPMKRAAAEALQINELDRFLGEFHIPRDEWEPMAREEIERLTEAGEDIKSGHLPDRFARDDYGAEIRLDPETVSNWQCDWCPHRMTCLEDGRGTIHKNDSVLKVREPLIPFIVAHEEDDPTTDVFGNPVPFGETF